MRRREPGRPAGREIDELVIKRYPIVIGSGVPMFSGPFDLNHFELTDNRSFSTGTVATYSRKQA